MDKDSVRIKIPFETWIVMVSGAFYEQIGAQCFSEEKSNFFRMSDDFESAQEDLLEMQKMTPGIEFLLLSPTHYARQSEFDASQWFVEDLPSGAVS